MPLPKTRRYRGVVLTAQGWSKLQAAKNQAEFNEKAGDRFTLEELSERMALSFNTIAKVLGRSEPVDKQSLQWAFRAFGLELSKSDFARPRAAIEEIEAVTQPMQSGWGTRIDTSTFCGRDEDLACLKQMKRVSPAAVYLLPSTLFCLELQTYQDSDSNTIL